jgi:hypothetical protein
MRSIPRSLALETFGVGWHPLINEFYNAFDSVSDLDGDLCVTRATYRSGMLYIRVADPREEELLNDNKSFSHIEHERSANALVEMLNGYTWYLERRSAKMCETCGEKGFRRKEVEGNPNRCNACYIKMMNEE